MTVGRMQIALGEHGGLRIKTRQDSSRSSLVGLRRAAQPTDFEQVCGAAQAALRISRVVSGVMWYVLTVSQHAGGRYG